VEAADDDTVVGLVQQGQGEALVPAGVRKWVEANEPLPREEVASSALHDCHPSGEFVQIAPDLVDRLEVLSEDGLKVAAFNAAR